MDLPSGRRQWIDRDRHLVRRTTAVRIRARDRISRRCRRGKRYTVTNPARPAVTAARARSRTRQGHRLARTDRHIRSRTNRRSGR